MRHRHRSSCFSLRSIGAKSSRETMIAPPVGLRRTAREYLKPATPRGMALFEMALVLPLFILGSTALVDTAALLRTRNALKEAAQASVRCLTTTDSPCAPIATTPQTTRQYRYFLPTTPPTVYGNMTEIPATIEERRAPVHRFEFDTSVLGTLYTGEARQQYQVTTQSVEAVKLGRYVLEEFGYYVDYIGAQFQVVDFYNRSLTATPSLDLKPDGSLTTSNVLSFNASVPVPEELTNGRGAVAFGVDSVCSREIVTDKGSIAGCALARAGNQLMSTMMFILEGSASGGSPSNPKEADVVLKISYRDAEGRLQTIPLGGQQFMVNGSNRAENFVPRGAPLGSSESFKFRYIEKTSYTETTEYNANVVKVPLGVPITFTAQFRNWSELSGTGATWTPTRLRVYLPTFTPKTVPLTCQENSCSSLAAKVGTCTTTPNVPGTLTKLSYAAEKKSISTPCLIASQAPQPPKSVKIPKTPFTCTPTTIQESAHTCSPLITAHTCDPANKGINNPVINGKTVAALDELLPACNPNPKPTGSRLLNSATATVVTKRITAPRTTTPITATAARTTCISAPTISRDKFPAEVQSYAVVNPIDMGTVADAFADLPASAAGQPRESLACLPNRELTNQEEPSILKSYAFLTTPHRDLGCALPKTLASAKAHVEQDARYQVNFSSPVVTGKFAFSDGTTPDSCTPHTISTPEISPKNTLDLGVFPEPTMPPQCATTQCVREFVGFSSTSETGPPSANIAAAISEAKAATKAYLPNAKPEDLQIQITPSSGGTGAPIKYEVTTRMTVPLSFQRRSTVEHVAHGKSEFAG